MGVVVTRRVDASAAFDKMLDQLDDRLHDVRALCHAKAATIRVFDWVGRDEIILHVNHEQCVIGIDRCAEKLEILAKEGRLARQSHPKVALPACYPSAPENVAAAMLP